MKSKSRRRSKIGKGRSRSRSGSGVNKSRFMSKEVNRRQSKCKQTENRQSSNQKSDPFVQFMQYLTHKGLINDSWSQNLDQILAHKLSKQAMKLFNNKSGSKESTKIKIINEICDNQIWFQEETLSNLVNKESSDLQSSKEHIIKDAMTILNEIPETDLNMSNNSIEEVQYHERYEDPEFQNLLASLKRL